jgi:Zn-dependent peptidase ImmA (M78 family)
MSAPRQSGGRSLRQYAAYAYVSIQHTAYASIQHTHTSAPRQSGGRSLRQYAAYAYVSIQHTHTSAYSIRIRQHLANQAAVGAELVSEVQVRDVPYLRFS